MLRPIVSTALFVAACAPLADAPPARRDAPSAVIEGLLRAQPDQYADLLDRADQLRLKVELAIVVDGPEGPRLERHSFDRGPEYFYPASAVKTCAAIAAFVELDRIRAETGAQVDRDTALRFLPLFEGEEVEDRDPSHVAGGAITAAHDARKVFLVSDNAAYNRLYELAGNDSVNALMRAAGLDTCRILHRLSEFRSPADQLRVPAIELLDDDGGVAHRLPERTSAFDETNADLGGTSIGTAHTSGSEVVDGPMSFARKNYVSLRDLVDMNVMLLRPDVSVEGGAGFPLSDADRAFVADAMASTPGASTDPVYDPARYPDDDSKFLLPGLLRLRPMDELVVRDKVGRAYGFSVTNSQVVDRRAGRTFFLAATLYTNPNGVVGDGVYDYARADRFFADLGETIGRYVLER